MGKIKDELLKKIYVRVYKTFPDSRQTLCGEPVQYDENGRAYFEIPSEFAQNALSIGYEVGQEFIKETQTQTQTQTIKERLKNG